MNLISKESRNLLKCEKTFESIFCGKGERIMNKRLYLGFDPGGAGAFGWCLAKGNENPPLTVVFRGIVNNAQEALEAAKKVKEGVAAVGIDAPLFWRPDGDRVVDSELRQRIIELGGHGGTINPVNSLRGACLVQGIMTAMLLRRNWPELQLTESHPKAILWICNIVTRGVPAREIPLANLNQFFIGENLNGASDHERDAALCALSAWAMINKPKGWHDLYPKEKAKENGPISPLDPPLAYWMPIQPPAKPRRKYAVH
jgi:predicted nuclease with RNAse H fold